MSNPTEIPNCFIQILSEVRGTVSTGFSNNSVRRNSVGDRLLFTSMPQNFQSTKSANLQQTPILGRSEPIKTYGSSGARVWNVELIFFANDNVITDVLDKIYWCESLAYPIYSNGVSQGLPVCLLAMGSYLNVKVLCSNVSTIIPEEWSIEGRGDVGGYTDAINANSTLNAFRADLPMHAIVNMDFEQVATTPFGHRDVLFGLHNRN